MFNPWEKKEFIKILSSSGTYVFSGRHWHEKIADMHVAMKERNADAMVVNGLDETACKFMRTHSVYRCPAVNVF